MVRLGVWEPLGATRWLVLSVRRWKVSRVRSRVGAPLGLWSSWVDWASRQGAGMQANAASRGWWACGYQATENAASPERRDNATRAACCRRLRTGSAA